MTPGSASNEEDIRKAIVAAHESVANLFSIFIPVLAVLFVAFQNAADNVEVLGVKFKPGQGALVSVTLIVVACYFCARNLFVTLSLLGQLQDKALVRMSLQSSAVPLNPFTNVPGWFGRVFNYTGLVLPHIAPIGVVLGFSDLIVAAQRSFVFATVHFLLVLVFLAVYFFIYLGLTGVIDVVNPMDALVRRRILKVTILVLAVAFLVYGYIANLPNLRQALQDMSTSNG